MVDAIGSILANAPLLQNDAQQRSQRVSTAEIQEARQQSLESSVRNFPQAPFISPVVSFDTRFDTAVLLLRNSEDGEVESQIPRESALEAEQRAQERENTVAGQAEIRSEQPTLTGLNSIQQQNLLADRTSIPESVSTQRTQDLASASANSLEAFQNIQAAQNSVRPGNSVNVNA